MSEVKFWAPGLHDMWVVTEANSQLIDESKMYVLASDYDALKARNKELVEALAEAQASYLRLAQSVRNCGHEHLLSDEDDAALSHTKEQP